MHWGSATPGQIITELVLLAEAELLEVLLPLVEEPEVEEPEDAELPDDVLLPDDVELPEDLELPEDVDESDEAELLEDVELPELVEEPLTDDPDILLLLEVELALKLLKLLEESEAGSHTS